MARPLENKANLHLVVLLALLKTKRCQALPALLGVFQQSLGLAETGGITLACSPEDEWQGGGREDTRVGIPVCVVFLASFSPAGSPLPNFGGWIKLNDMSSILDCSHPILT